MLRAKIYLIFVCHDKMFCCIQEKYISESKILQEIEEKNCPLEILLIDICNFGANLF